MRQLVYLWVIAFCLVGVIIGCDDDDDDVDSGTGGDTDTDTDTDSDSDLSEFFISYKANGVDQRFELQDPGLCFPDPSTLDPDLGVACMYSNADTTNMITIGFPASPTPVLVTTCSFSLKYLLSSWPASS
jgi:hypothetical protein